MKLRLAVQHPEAYVVAVKRPEGGAAAAAAGGGSPTLAVWLMSSGIIFDTFAARAHAVVLASGTMSPLRAMSAELAASAAFSARAQPEGPLEAGHVIGQSQVHAAVVTRFPGSGHPIVSTFGSWRSANFLAELGGAIAELLEAIPAGVLCFLPSYSALEACTTAWRCASSGTTPLWSRFQLAKGEVVVEPRGASSLDEARDAFVGAVRRGVGALCFAVYRGKMSEGLSFDDDLCRGVICVGVPYPQAKDPVVIAKRRWNDARRSAGAGPMMLSGNEWYELQAHRAVNQALGRCVRHRLDFGALVLLDARWASQGHGARRLRQYLARWMQPFIGEWPKSGPGANVGNGCPGAAGCWGGLTARLRDLFVQASATVAAQQALEASTHRAGQEHQGLPVRVPQLSLADHRATRLANYAPVGIMQPQVAGGRVPAFSPATPSQEEAPTKRSRSDFEGGSGERRPLLPIKQN